MITFEGAKNWVISDNLFTGQSSLQNKIASSKTLGHDRELQNISDSVTFNIGAP